MPRALIIGGTGLIGQAAARRLLAAGWEVDLTGRDPAHLPAGVAADGARFVAAERDDPAQLAAALGTGADLLSGHPVTVVRPSKIHGAGALRALLDDDADEALGRHPWEARHPIVLDMTAAADLGYTPAGDYEATVAEEVEWLVAVASGAQPGVLPGADDDFFGPLLDYTAEDRYLAASAVGGGVR